MLKDFLPRNFTVTGHTGCLSEDGTKTKDNSLESIREAVLCGADIVEIDVRFLADGKPVLSHDAVFDDAKNTVVSLDAAFACLAEYPHLQMNVDLKSTDNLEAVRYLAEKHGVLDRIFFTGVDRKWAKTVSDAGVGIPYYLNYGVSRILAGQTWYCMYLVRLCKSLGCMGLNINKVGATKKLSRILHEHGLLLSVWTCTQATDIRRALRCEPDNITSRNPALVKKMLNEE